MSGQIMKMAPEAIDCQLTASIAWERDANLRDVLVRKDLSHDSALTAEVVHDRTRSERGPEPPLEVPYPKDDGDFRRTCVLDPFDDLRFSLLASALAPFANSALPDCRTVISTRFLPAGRGCFRAEGWREARKRRDKSLDRAGRLPLGGFDVQNHYATVSRSSLLSVMNSCLAPAWLVDACEEFLASLSSWPGAPQGLPTGPMASALFGTLALLPADRALARLGVPYERWVDDFVTQPEDEAHFEIVRNEVDFTLQPHQQLNPEKDWFEPRNEPDPSQFAESIPNDGFAHLNQFDELRAAVDQGDAKRCRYLLGGLRYKKNSRAVPFVVSDYRIWTLAPKHAGDYLSTFRGDLTGDQLDELVDFCTATPRKETAAGIAHAAAVLGKRRVPKSCGHALYEAGERSSTGDFRAVTPALYFACSISNEKPRYRQTRSIDAAAALRDLNCQRGLLAGLRYDTRPRLVDAGLRALGDAVPDLRPTVEWVRANDP